MRKQLRKDPPVYDGTRDNFESANHAMRALVSGAMVATIAPKTVLDPACGDASILEAAHRLRPIELAYLSDISQAQMDVIKPSFPHAKWTGDLLAAIDRAPRVDMIVLTEILEHVKDPNLALRFARISSDFLLASSPIGDPEGGRNKEHLWSFSEEDYETMLREEGWEPIAKQVQTFPGTPWNSQIWLAR